MANIITNYSLIQTYNKTVNNKIINKNKNKMIKARIKCKITIKRKTKIYNMQCKNRRKRVWSKMIENNQQLK